MKYKIVNCLDDNLSKYELLEETDDLFEAENFLLYYVNHEYDAYLTEDDEF